MKGAARFWIAGFAAALALHGAIATGIVYWPGRDQPAAPPPAAMLIELAPLPAAPTPVPTEAPPAPREIVETLPPEPEPEPEPPPILEKIELPPPPPTLVEPPEVVLPAPAPPRPRPRVPTPPRQEPRPEPVREEPPPAPTPQPPQATAAPQAAPQQAPVAAAPRQDPPTPAPPSNALPTWRTLLLGHLERLKRYPADARWRRQQGTVYLRFTMDRQGRVLRAAIERSSGAEPLDNEVLGLITRAQPLPVPPDEIQGDTIELIVPVQFYLR